MPIIEPVDEYARPPRVRADARTARVTPTESDLEPVDGWIELDGFDLIDADLDCRDAEVVVMKDCRIENTMMLISPATPLRLHRTEVVGCDLSRTGIGFVTGSRLTRCKFAGTELLGAIEDTEFVGSMFQLTNFHEATLDRVGFVDCTLREVEFYGATLADVSVSGCAFERVGIDKARFERVDLREATALGFTHIGDMTGCLITAVQAHELALDLALSAGAAFEVEH